MTRSPPRPKRSRRWNALRRDARRFGRLGRLLRPHTAGHGRLAVAGAGASAGLLAAQLAQPWPLKWIFDLLGGNPAPFSSLPPEQALAAFAGIYLGIAVVAAGFEYAQLLLLASLGNRVIAGFRRTLFRHVLRLPLAWHEKKEVGELLTRVVSDTARLRRGVNGVLLRTVQTVALFAATSVILLWLNAPLALIAAATGGLGLLLMAGTGRRILRAARRQREREGRLAGVVEESLAGIRDLQLHRPGDTPDPRFERENAKSLKEEQKVRRLEGRLFLTVNVLLAFSLLAVLWLGARQVRADGITAGDLVLFVHYLLSLYRPFNVFAHQSARTGRTLACSERLVKILEREPAIADAPGALPAPRLAGEVAFEAVTLKAKRKRRGGRRRILQGVTFRVGAGERVAVVGPNGAGKSSLVLLLARLAEPRVGRIEIDGQDVRAFTIESLRAQISAVQQEPALFGLSVRENVALGAPAVDRAGVEAALRRARALELVERLPAGLDTRIRRRGRLFSAGERQRLAVARALARDGRIWLLDEPTSGLDAEAAESITALLREVTAGKTTFWVTHEPAIAMSLDKVLVLVKGRLRFAGTPAELRDWLGRKIPGVKAEALRRYYEQLQAA